jgi:hypothetical protein
VSQKKKKDILSLVPLPYFRDWKRDGLNSVVWLKKPLLQWEPKEHGLPRGQNKTLGLHLLSWSLVFPDSAEFRGVITARVLVRSPHHLSQQ